MNGDGETTTAAATPAKRPPYRTTRTKIDRLVLDEANARLHGEQNLAAIEASLAAHGQVEPVLVQKSTMRIVGGHGRIAAMKRLGWTDCDTWILDLNDADAKALAVRLNRTGELAGWDAEALGKALDDLAGFGLSMDDLGFGEADLDALLGEVGEDGARGPREVRFVAGGDGGPPEQFPEADPKPNVECPKCGFGWRVPGGAS